MQSAVFIPQNSPVNLVGVIFVHSYLFKIHTLHEICEEFLCGR